MIKRLFYRLFLRRKYRLLAAIDVLCEVHTADASHGFVVKMGAMPDRYGGPPSEVYVDAWKTLRESVGLPTKGD